MVRVQATFSRFPGLYLYHCHILEHEDMGMMRNFRITWAIWGQVKNITVWVDWGQASTDREPGSRVLWQFQ
jgi:hypothetical protein